MWWAGVESGFNMHEKLLFLLNLMTQANVYLYLNQQWLDLFENVFNSTHIHPPFPEITLKNLIHLGNDELNLIFFLDVMFLILLTNLTVNVFMEVCIRGTTQHVYAAMSAPYLTRFAGVN